MPLITIIANWLKGWGVAEVPYIEWLTPITVNLMPMKSINILLHSNSPNVVLMPNSAIDVGVESDNGILVKLVSNEVVDVVVER